MSPAPTARRRYLIARIARVTADAAWWVFVIARLMVEMNSYGLPRRYADYSSTLFTTDLSRADRGWTAYTPLTDRLPPGLREPVVAADIVSTCVIGALAVVMTAAVVEAIAVGRWPAGVGTIAAPIISAALILFALHERTGGLFSALQLNLVIVFVLVLVGVAIRQVWSQTLAPRRSRSI